MDKPEKCKGCPLYEHDGVFQEDLGSGTIEIRGQRMRDMDGWAYLDKFLPLAGLSSDEVTLSNALRCFEIPHAHAENWGLPIKGKVLDHALRQCRQFDRQVPQLYVAVGELAWRSFGLKGNIYNWRGSQQLVAIHNMTKETLSEEEGA